MGEQKPEKKKKHVSAALLAHVDAGKTTLSEGILYLGGSIRSLGRVDHKNAFLDHSEIERSRGITIFSKQAEVQLKECRVTLLDTPGHVDFSAEMERTLQVLDYAVLVINGADGVQGHTRTLWGLLDRYRVPVFLFVNKMDQEGTDKNALLQELKSQLSENCVEFGGDESSEEFRENIAVCDERILERYLETGCVETEEIAGMIAGRRLFPCYFGSALKMEGVREFIEGFSAYTEEKKYPEQFGAKVYKISRDAQGNRLTHMKITGGKLKVRDLLGNKPDAENHWEEKVNQIRIYSGEKYDTVSEAEAGTICAVTGLSGTYPGEGLGMESASGPPVLEPVLNYQIQFPEGADVHTMLGNLRQLEEEDPMLRVLWLEELEEIHVQLMGEVQIEILKSLMKERFGVEVEFGTGSIVYKETIQKTAEGVGHFEPLRHYAEVHLLLEPGEPGSGVVFDTACSEDMLDRNWQRLILTHLEEKEHKGVLTGSAITDMKITLMAGRAHLKHTEGGDFRQATYRAVRQGLMQADSILLEPYYAFRLEVPAEMVGRAMTDIQRMHGEFEPPKTHGETAVLTGSAPVAGMRDYTMEVNGYTRGLGRLSCTLKGYKPCHNAEEVMEAIGYDADSDLDNPSGSVFCSRGAGFYVSWEKVPEHMHLRSCLLEQEKEQGKEKEPQSKTAARPNRKAELDDRELEEIFIRTYGKIERKRSPGAQQRIQPPGDKAGKKKASSAKEYVLVDGYNVIFAWEDLKELAQTNIEGARSRLMDVLCNYQGYKNCEVILVFDAYKVEGDAMEIQRYHNIHVVYTKEAETADQYIEKVVHEIGKKYHVTVVTSDGVEQVITRGQGGSLKSAREFYEDIKIMRKELRDEYMDRPKTGRSYLFDYMDDEMSQHMEEIRMGKKEW